MAGQRRRRITQNNLACVIYKIKWCIMSEFPGCLLIIFCCFCTAGLFISRGYRDNIVHNVVLIITCTYIYIYIYINKVSVY